MKPALLCVVVAAALYACSREDPAVGQPASPQTRIDETKQVEKAAEAGKPLSDTALTQIVKTALQSESSLNAQKIDVENRNGNVTLHGVVGSEEQKEKAGRIAGSVGGVRSVANNLTVDPSASVGATTGGSATILQRKD
jgi:hyperosmotically inducible periplasmic protein